MSGRTRALLLAGLLLVAAGEVLAQTEPPLVHHIHGLAVDPKDSELLYVATHTGLVRIRPGAAPEWVGSHRFDVMGFTAHPAQAGLVYASGHPDLPTYRRDAVGHLGLIVSRDGGQTWRSIALRGEADFHALTYTPHEGGRLYGWSVAGQTGLHRISVASGAVERVGARGLADVLSLSASPDGPGPLLAGTKAGLLVSRDGGATWAKVKSIPADAPVTAVGFHRADSRLVYAYLAAPGLGLRRSRDGGASWEPTGPLPSPAASAVALAVGPGEHVVVATAAADVLRSSDGGRSWTRVIEQGRPAQAGR